MTLKRAVLKVLEDLRAQKLASVRQLSGMDDLRRLQGHLDGLDSAETAILETWKTYSDDDGSE